MKSLLFVFVLLSLSQANAGSYSCRPAGARDITETARVDMYTRDNRTVSYAVALRFPRPTKKDQWKGKLYDAVTCPVNATLPAGEQPDLKCNTTADSVHKKQGIAAFRSHVYLGLDGTPVKVKTFTVNTKGVTEERATLDKCTPLLRHHD